MKREDEKGSKLDLILDSDDWEGGRGGGDCSWEGGLNPSERTESPIKSRRKSKEIPRNEGRSESDRIEKGISGGKKTSPVN